MEHEVRDHQRHIDKQFVGSPRYTLEVDFKDYAAELNGDIASAARGRSAAAK